MNGLPRKLEEKEQVTGLGCPDCSGVLNAAVEGPSQALHFRCRVGHAYSAAGVITGKEKQIEESLWGAMAALEELMVFLRELVALGEAGTLAEEYENRARRAAEQVRKLREVVEKNVPTALAE